MSTAPRLGLFDFFIGALACIILRPVIEDNEEYLSAVLAFTLAYGAVKFFLIPLFEGPEDDT
jgi:hypothetical protein